MLSQLAQEIDTFIEISKGLMPILLKWVAALWAFNLFNWIILGGRLNALGIKPRRASGLIGIITSPILHADFAHLLFNSVPLFFLGLFMMSLGLTQFYIATIIITLISGVGVWCVGRRGNHIGASAVISGYFGFILANAYHQPTFTAIFCAGVAFYYFGSILLSLFPGREEMSWEGHLAGFIGGVIAAFLAPLIMQFYSGLLA